MAQRAPRASGRDDDVMRVYLDDIAGRPLLTRDDEERLARAIEEGREAARELHEGDGALPPERQRMLRRLIALCEESTRRFVEANLRLVVSIAKRYRHPRLSLPDLVQEGNLGLMRAVRKFDHRKGFRFSTYATWWIRQAISRAISDTGRLVRLPADAGDKLARIRRTSDRLEAELGRRPTPDEVGAELGMAAARVRELLQASAETVSISERHGSGDVPELGDAIADPLAERALEELLPALAPEEVDRLLSSLDARSKDVLRLRLGLDGGPSRSRAAVGECLGITGERARQIEARALARLRADPEVARAWEELRGA